MLIFLFFFHWSSTNLLLDSRLEICFIIKLHACLSGTVYDWSIRSINMISVQKASLSTSCTRAVMNLTLHTINEKTIDLLRSTATLSWAEFPVNNTKQEPLQTEVSPEIFEDTTRRLIFTNPFISLQSIKTWYVRTVPN